MERFIYIIILFLMNSCVLSINEDENGNKSLKPKYPLGTGIMYQDGTYSTNHRYNSNRPQVIPVIKDKDSK